MNSKFALTCVLLLSMVIYHRWFSFGIFTHTDWWFGYPETIRNFVDLSIWRPESLFGMYDATSFRVPINFVFGLFAILLGVSSSSIDHIILFPVQIFLLPFASYLFIKEITKNVSGAFIGSIILTFNAYFLTITTAGHGFIIVSAAFCIFSLYYLVKGLEAGLARDYVFSAIWISIAGYFDFRILYINFLIIILLFGVTLYKEWSLSIIKKFFLFLFLVVLLNLFWIIPVPFLVGTFAGEILSRQLFGDAFWSLSHAIALAHPFWTGGRPAWFTMQPIPLANWLLPIVAIFGMYLLRRNIYVIVFSIVAIVGIFLTKQSDAPYGAVYYWLYNNIPGFNAFREASKFYYFIAIAYAVLIAFFIKYLEVDKQKNLIRTILIVAISLVILFNGVPLMTGSVKTMFTKRYPQADYSIFRTLTLSSSDFYRTLWAPTTSKWVSYTDVHPRVSLVDFFTTNSSFLTDAQLKEPIENRLVSMVKSSFSRMIIGAAAIKYIGIPIQDIENDSDFFISYGGANNPNIRNWYIGKFDEISYLRKLELKTADLVVYINDDYRQYFEGVSELIRMDSLLNLNEKYSYVLNKYQKDVDFYVPSSSDHIPSVGLSLLYENLGIDNLQGNAIVQNYTADKGAVLYMNNAPSITYFVPNQNGYSILNRTDDADFSVNGISVMRQKSEEVLYQGDAESIPSYIQVGSRILKIEQGVTSPIRLGSSLQKLSLISTTEDSAIANASFEDRLWQEKVEDCNKYDNNGNIAQRFSDITYSGDSSLELEATKHIACTELRNIFVESGQEYIFSFAYQSDNAKYAGFYLNMNGSDGETVSEKVPIKSSNWNVFFKKIIIPDDVKTMSITLYSYDEDGATPIKVRYDEVRLEKVSVIADIDPSRPATFEPVVAEIPTESTFKLSDSTVDMRNLFINSNFSNGLWNKTVGDCNNYDGNGAVSQGLVADTRDGGQSLELVAARHIACTGPGPVPVTEESTYLLSFDYQSPNAKETGFYIGWGGTSADPVNERISVKDTGWHTYTKQITAPLGASSASLLVYAYEKDGVTPIRVRYDNFHFIELPEIKNRFYLLSDPELKFEKPKEVGFDLVNPTKRLAHIAGATTSFYLTMSEAYHPQWQAELNNEKVGGWLDSWIPWVQPDVIPESYHFKLDGFLNGWYVDPVELCGTKENLKEGCSMNDDGSYDIELTIEFTPQRWFYVGLIISGLTLASCLGYLGYSGIRSYRQRKALRQS